MTDNEHRVEVNCSVQLTLWELKELVEEAERLHMQPDELLQQMIIIHLAQISAEKKEAAITGSLSIVEPKGPHFQPPNPPPTNEFRDHEA